MSNYGRVGCSAEIVDKPESYVEYREQAAYPGILLYNRYSEAPYSRTADYIKGSSVVYYRNNKEQYHKYSRQVLRESDSLLSQDKADDSLHYGNYYDTCGRQTAVYGILRHKK